MATSTTRATPEERARWRRRVHANYEAMINLVIDEIVRCAAVAYAAAQPEDDKPPDFQMPAHVRCLLSALMGTHGGGTVPFEEFTRSYLRIGQQLQFTGTDTAIRARVRRWLDDLLAWQRLVGYELISVVKGGEIVGYEKDSTPIRKSSTFINNFLPHADDGVMRARASELWRSNPGDALAAQAASVLKALPRLTPQSANVPKDTSPLPLDKYEQQREERLLAQLEEAAERIEQRGGEGWEFVDRFAMLAARLANSLRKTEPARRDAAALSIFETEQADDSAWDEAERAHLEAKADRAGLCNKNVTQAPPQTTPAQEVTDPPICTIADFEALSLPQAALFWAGQGIPVFPLYGVADGVCDCREGSECKSPGKHPLTRNGLKDATTNKRQIKLWWTQHPHANISGAMGGEMRLLAVDIDPKHGGDATLYDLTEAHGPEWLDTLNTQTGSKGDHFIFNYPHDVELKNSAGKLGPGIDTRAEGGYIVLPPSVHASGRRYRLKNTTATREAPAWLIEALTRTPEQTPSVVVDFQERRERKSGGVIAEGERNERVFKVGCALWGHGEAADVTDLHVQLLQVNAERCSPPLADAEVAQIAASIAARYVRGVPIQEGAA
jgi:hypothetical protein